MKTLIIVWTAFLVLGAMTLLVPKEPDKPCDSKLDRNCLVRGTTMTLESYDNLSRALALAKAQEENETKAKAEMEILRRKGK